MDAGDPHAAMAMPYGSYPTYLDQQQHPHMEIRPHIPHPTAFSQSHPSMLPPPPPDPYGLNYPQGQGQVQVQVHTPSGGASAGYGMMNPELQKIHTLFIAGLPDDVKAREIHNLFRRRPGFDSCQLKYTGKGNQVVAFATFFNHQSAVAAMNSLNGVAFDPQTGATLHVELARSNSRNKRPRGGGVYTIIDNRAKVANDTHETESDDGDGGYDDTSGTDNPNSGNKDALAATQSGEAKCDLDNSHNTLNQEQSEKPVSGEIPPCSTLFIANLGPNCTEEELKQVVSQYTGFHMLKMRARGGMPVAFADFEEVEHATEAMKNLQGSLLPSSDRGGMHLEYARSKMRKS